MIEVLNNSSSPKPKRGAARLEMPVGKPSREFLLSFVRECLAPLLAEEFLRTRRSIQPEGAVTPKKPTTGVPGEEGGRSGPLF